MVVSYHYDAWPGYNKPQEIRTTNSLDGPRLKTTREQEQLYCTCMRELENITTIQTHVMNLQKLPGLKINSYQ